MKINEIITEVFNPETSFPIEWDDRHGPEEMHGRAYDRQGGFIDIKFIALRNGVVEVEFSRNDSYDMTGAGDANRVLGTILEAFREYLLGYRPKIFVFSAKGGSRSRVYQSMIRRFAAGAGYKQFDTAKLSDKARKQLGHSGSDVMVLRRATVTETFDKPYAFNWSRGDHGDYDVFVKLPDGSPLNIAFNREGDDGWHVAFDRGHSQEITGEGDAQRIFATVLTAIQQFILKEEPDRLYFSASKDVEPGQSSTSRARLYERMVRRYANSLGYDVVVDDRSGHTMFVLDKDPTVAEDRHPNDKPYGPETKPTMPKGTVRVDVSDVYDWYKLGMNISNLDKADKRIFGKGPPSTIMAFGSEDEEHEYIQALQKLGLTTTDIDPKDPNQPKNMPRQKVDPTFNVNESNDGKTLWHINSYDNFETAFEIDLVIDGKDIGFFSYQYDPEQDTVENDIRIINDSERGHGYGKLLLLKAIETAQQHNLPYKRDHRGTSSAQSRVYSSLINDGIIKVGHDKTITLTGKNLSTTKEKNPRFSLIAQGQYVGHFDDHEDAKREADRIANDPNSKYPLVSVKDNSSKLVSYEAWPGKDLEENFADGKVKGKSRPGRVKRAGASCNGSVTDLRARAKNASGEKAKMYHWCANMKSGRNK